MKLEFRKTDKQRIAPPKKQEERRYKAIRLAHFKGFVPFLLLAFVVWFLQSLQREITRPIYIPIALDSMGQMYQIEEDKVPSLLELQVRDKTVEHILYALEEIDTIRLSKLYDHEGYEYIGIGRKELGEFIAHLLSSTAQVVQKSLSEVKVPISKRVSKRIPVRISSQLYVDKGFVVSSVTPYPDSITVYGEQAILEPLKSIYTVDLRDTVKGQIIERDISLKFTDKRIYADVKKVRVKILVDELTERSFELPITVLGAPQGYELRVIPRTSTVLITVPRSQYSSIHADSLQLVADYTKEVEETGEISLRLMERQDSKFVSVRISPNRVQVIKELVKP